MAKFHSMTLQELLSEAKSAGDLPMVGGANYGDRLGTIQAMPLTGLILGAVRESGYSNTRFKIVEGDDISESDQKVVVLNEDETNVIDCALTGKELVEEINSFVASNGESVLELNVAYGSDYGDRSGTIQANGAHLCETGSCALSDTAYSQTSMKILSEEDYEDEGDDVEETHYTVG